MALSRILSVLAMALAALIVPALAQVSTPCSPSMISSFTPCFSFITNSSANGTTSPTADCCNSIKSLASTGVGCLCLILTANIPIPLPINRTLAISLPRACNMPGLPLQCKASGSPIPAPGPMALSPTSSAPGASPSGNPIAPATPAPRAEPPPESNAPPALTPPPPPPEASNTPGSRPVVTPPSASGAAHVSSPLLFLISVLVSFMVKFY